MCTHVYDNFRVFAREHIRANTKFGPYDGCLKDKELFGNMYWTVSNCYFFDYFVTFTMGNEIKMFVLILTVCCCRLVLYAK